MSVMMIVLGKLERRLNQLKVIFLNSRRSMQFIEIGSIPRYWCGSRKANSREKVHEPAANCIAINFNNFKQLGN